MRLQRGIKGHFISRDDNGTNARDGPELRSAGSTIAGTPLPDCAVLIRLTASAAGVKIWSTCASWDVTIEPKGG